MKIYSTLMYLYSLGQKDGSQRGLRVGACQQLGKLLFRHGKRLFGPPTDEQRIFLDHLIERDALEALEQVRDRLLRVTDWTALLADVPLPAARPADPDYLVAYDFDPTPMSPSLDEFARVTTKIGQPLIIHLRLQRVYEEKIGAILYRESKRLEAQHGHVVQSCVVLMWPGADGPAMTGEYEVPTGGTFRYSLTRMWEKDFEESLSSIGTATHAPLCRFAPERLPEVLRRMEEVIETQSPSEEAKGKAWFVAYASMGLRYSAEQVNEWLAHKLPLIFQRKEVKAILSEGYHEGLTEAITVGALQVTRAWITSQGRERLGEPLFDLAKGLESISNQDRLEELAARVLKAATWQAALAH